jgi:hypothetical protein
MSELCVPLREKANALQPTNCQTKREQSLLSGVGDNRLSNGYKLSGMHDVFFYREKKMMLTSMVYYFT